MNPRLLLSLVGLSMFFLPGCCVFEAVFGFGRYWGPGAGCCTQTECDIGQESRSDRKARKKCAKKCRKCRECLEEEGLAGPGLGGMGIGGMGYSGMPYGDIGMTGDCGCGGGGGMMMGEPSCGCASCGMGGMGGPSYSAPPTFTTPQMQIPTPGPVPQSGTALPPPIPPAESGSTFQVPQGTQQVSVEEFQRLPGVVISGPGSQPVAGAAPVGTVATTTNIPAPLAAPANAQPIETATAKSATPSAAKQVQPAGWVPARQ